MGLTAESLERIRLAQGVVGKTTYITFLVLALLGSLLWRLNEPWMLLTVGGSIILIFLIFFIGILIFAHRNPDLALLEGAELLTWRKIALAAKSIPEPPLTPAIPDPKAPEAPPIQTDGPDK